MRQKFSQLRRIPSTATSGYQQTENSHVSSGRLVFLRGGRRVSGGRRTKRLLLQQAAFATGRRLSAVMKARPQRTMIAISVRGWLSRAGSTVAVPGRLAMR
ncbi:hypothetical protein V3C99_006412 [Haemonchus contortus]